MLNKCVFAQVNKASLSNKRFRNTYLLPKRSCVISMTTVRYQIESLGQCEHNGLSRTFHSFYETACVLHLPVHCLCMIHIHE